MLAGRVWGYDRLAAALCQPVAQPPRIVGTVGQEAARGGNARQKLGNPGQVMRLACRQTKCNGSSGLVGQGMNLGRPSAA